MDLYHSFMQIKIYELGGINVHADDWYANIDIPYIWRLCYLLMVIK